jgi:hypothetical protein
MASDDAIGVTADRAGPPAGETRVEDDIRIISDPSDPEVIGAPERAAPATAEAAAVPEDAPLPHTPDVPALSPAVDAAPSAHLPDAAVGFDQTRWRVAASTPAPFVVTHPPAIHDGNDTAADMEAGDDADPAGSVTPSAPDGVTQAAVFTDAAGSALSEQGATEVLAADAATDAQEAELPTPPTKVATPTITLPPADDVAPASTAAQELTGDDGPAAWVAEMHPSAPQYASRAPGGLAAEDPPPAAAPAGEAAPPDEALAAVGPAVGRAGPTIPARDRAVAISDRPTTPMLPDMPDLDQQEPSIVDRLESLSQLIEELVDALGPIGTSTSLPNEPVRAAIPEAGDMSVRAWLRILIYLGRVVAPACRDALEFENMGRARPLAMEIVQAAPAVAGAVRASIVLAGFTLGAASEEPGANAAPALRQALASDRVARCLAHLLNDLTALETWLGSGATGASARSWVSAGWPEPHVTAPTRAASAPASLIPRPMPHDVAPLSATAGLPPLPPLLPLRPTGPWDGARASAAPARYPYGSHAPLQQQSTPPATRAAPQLTPPATARSVAGASGPADWSRYGAGDRRILRVVIVVALLFLMPGVLLLLHPDFSLATRAPGGGAVPTSAVALAASPTVAPVPTATAAPMPTSTPRSPTPHPTAPPVTPTVSALTLTCGSPGVVLPLYNSGAAPQSWTLTLPTGVSTDGLRGVVNPGKTYTIDLWALPGTRSGSATAYLVSAGHRAPIKLTVPGC